MRQKSIQNIHDALDQLHRKKSKAHNDVSNNLEGLKHRYSLKQAAIEQANHVQFNITLEYVFVDKKIASEGEEQSEQVFPKEEH